MKQEKTFKLDENLPFNSGVNGGPLVFPKLNREDLIREEYEAARNLLDYFLNKIDRSEFVVWVLNVIERLSDLPKNRDTLFYLSQIAELLVKGATQDEIIRTFNGFDILEYGLNIIIKKASQAFYVYCDHTSDNIDIAEFDHHFKMVRHLVVLNEMYHNYNWAGIRLNHLEKEHA